MTQRDVVFPPGRQALYEKNRYSPAIRSNGFLFVSGQVGSRPDGSREPDLEAQVRLAFENLNAILAAANCTFDDVVDVTVFIVDPRQGDKFVEMRAGFFPSGNYPASALITVSNFARSGMLIEIQGVAVIGG